MASINILTTPAQSYAYKMVPVYNGLPFVVNSTQKSRDNFKYIADVYVSGVKITTLKQNKDISNSEYGIFDIERIVENYIRTSRANFTTYGFAGNIDAYKEYYIKFGCEFEKTLTITSIISNPSDGEYCRVTFSQPHELRVGDFIQISNTKKHNYRAKIVSITNSTTVNTDLYYMGAYYGTGPETSGNAIEMEGFYDNAYVDGGYIGFAIPVTRPTRIKVGDRVTIKQTNFPTAPKYYGYDGEWLCTRIYNQVIGGVTYQIIATDAPFLGNTPVNGGSIYSPSKYDYRNLAESTSEYAFDGGLQYKEWLSYSPTNYVMNSTLRGKFLTNSPRTIKIRRDELATLSFFHTSIMGTGSAKMLVYAYNAAGTPVGNAQFSIGSTTAVYARLEAGVGVVQLQTIPGFSLASASYYEVYLANAGNTRSSEIFRFNIDDTCYRYTQKRLKFKNRLGGWDYFTFNLRSDKTTNIDRSNFNKFSKSLQAANKYGYAMGDRGRTTYNVKAVDSEVLQSNWLNNDEATWLEELFTSPEVYLMDGTNELPVIVKNESFVLGEKENIGLIAYTINIEYSFNKVIQRF